MYKIQKDNRYGRLIALESGPTTRKIACICDCGVRKKINGRHLNSGATRSCGCLQSEITAERNTKHGLTVRGAMHPLYNIYYAIMHRCYSSDDQAFKDYGGRGISVQESWRSDVQLFVNYCKLLPDYENRIKQNLTLDRIDNNGNYEEGNLRWTNRSEQRLNQRK